MIKFLLSFFNWKRKSIKYRIGFCKPYECGFISFGLSLTKFSERFLIILVFFVVLDVEVALLLKGVLMGVS